MIPMSKIVQTELLPQHTHASRDASQSSGNPPLWVVIFSSASSFAYSSSLRQAQSNGLISHIAIDCRRFLSDKISEVKPNFGKHLSMLPCPLHAFRPRLTPVFSAAELPRQDDIECLDLFLCPLDTGAHHGRREAALEAGDRILDDAKVDEGQLPDIEMQVSLENTLTIRPISKCLWFILSC